MKDMMKNRDIIITGLQPWDIPIGSNCKNLAAEFSKHNRVLYVNGPLDRLTLIKKRNTPSVKHRREIISGQTPAIEKINNNLWVLNPRVVIESISRLKSNLLFDIINKRNNKLLAREIQNVVSELGFKDFILFNDSDMFRSFYLKELLNPSTYIYYSRDNLLAVDFWKTQGTRIEPKHMQKSDLVLTNSHYLRDLAKRFNPRSYFVGQGCDTVAYSSFNEKLRPGDMNDIPSPIIGYMGSLNSLRLDLEIIRNIAIKKPEWSIVLVGPEDKVFKESVLHNLPNVYFLGNKNEAELPQYLSGFDVAINPQCLNQVTIGNYPRKIDEYLAMGKATVATLTKTMEYFSEHCYLASNAFEYVEMISKALKEDNLKKQTSRREFANQHTWENNANAIYEKITIKERHHDHNKKNNFQSKTESTGSTSFNSKQSTKASSLGEMAY